MHVCVFMKEDHMIDNGIRKWRKRQKREMERTIMCFKMEKQQKGR